MNIEYIVKIYTDYGKEYKDIRGIKIEKEELRGTYFSKGEFIDKNGNQVNIELPPTKSYNGITVSIGDSKESNLDYEYKHVGKSDLEENIIRKEDGSFIVNYENLEHKEFYRQY